MDEARRTRKNLWMFPLGTVGRDMIYTLFTNFILTYILFTRSLTAAQLSAVTVIMVAARVFDALNDPVMGNIIERTRSRYGKFKPWLLAGILLTSAVVYAAFNTRLEGWSFVAFFGFIYLMYSIAYTMHDISYWGMVAALGSDEDTRNRFTSRATLFAGVGVTLASVVIPMFTTGEMALGGNAETAYGRVALIVCLLAPLFLCFTIFGVRENRDEMKEKAPPVSFRKIWNTITGNDQLLWIALIFLVQQVGNNLVVGGIGSTYIYLAFGYRGGLYSLFTIVGVAATAFLMVFYPTISRHITRKRLMSIMMAVSTVGYALTLGCGLLLSSGMPQFWLVTLGYMLSNFGQYCFYLMMMISIINTVEYNEYRFGRRDEAIITSLRPFLTKMSSAVVAALTTVGYLIFGVTGYTNQISALEQQSAQGLLAEAEKLAQIDQVLSGVSSWQTRGLLLCMTVLPFALMLTAYLLYQKKYKLDEDEYRRICRELEEKKKAI